MSNVLKRFTAEELKAELALRAVEEEVKKPQKLENMDFSSLIKTVEGYIDRVDANKFEDDDDSHYIFEAAVEAIYGHDIWEWIKQTLR